MSRNKYAFNVLQAIALVASLAVILWSLGFPTLQFAQAANVTSFSATMSDSAPSAASNYTIEFTTPTGVAATETIVLTYDATFAGINAVEFGDVDLVIDGVEATVAATAAAGVWGVSSDATSITFTSLDTTVTAGDVVEIEIGTNATAGVTGVNQITNPAKVAVTEGEGDSYELQLTAGSADSGETRVVIVEGVTVTATVDTIFTFTVQGITSGASLSGFASDTVGKTTTATEIPFGELVADNATTAAQRLLVSTNAANGFAVTAAVDQQLTSSNGAVIDSFIDGNNQTTPIAWDVPSGSLGAPNEYGHWGMTSNDITLSGGDTYTAGVNYVAASSTPVEVFYHTGVADGSTQNEGVAEVLYKVEVTELQEAADDYTATLTYVATPVF